jgi:hypothetical protein
MRPELLHSRAASFAHITPLSSHATPHQIELCTHSNPDKRLSSLWAIIIEAEEAVHQDLDIFDANTNRAEAASSIPNIIYATVVRSMFQYLIVDTGVLKSRKRGSSRWYLV